METESLLNHEDQDQERERKREKKKVYLKRKKERERQERAENVDSETSAPLLEAMKLKNEAKDNLEKWEYFCNMVKDFHARSKRLPNLRSNDRNERVLGRWLFLQKSRHKNGKMHRYHATRLSEAGLKLSKNECV